MDLLLDLNICRDIGSMQTSTRQCFHFLLFIFSFANTSNSVSPDFFSYCVLTQEEEEERSGRWKDFLERQAKSIEKPSSEESSIALSGEVSGDQRDNEKSDEETVAKEVKTHKIQIWAHIRPSLAAIEQVMSSRVKNGKDSTKDTKDLGRNSIHLASIDDAKQFEDSDDEFYDVERSDLNQEVASNDSTNTDSSGTMASEHVSPEPFSPWKEEMECLVQGGLPMALRGEVHLLLHT